MFQTCSVSVIGGGLSGCEAAWQLARRGVDVKLYEMRPAKLTPAHETGLLSELVCSNSLGGEKPVTPAGILKQELSAMDSLIMQCAYETKVPAGNALAVDRERFAALVDKKISENKNIEVIRQEITEIPQGNVIIATGPLTSEKLASEIGKLTGENFLYFYDAVAPVVTLESVDMNCAYRANRYGDTGDYINCPMDEATYAHFYNELVNADTAPRHAFENEEIKHFEGCLPVEVIAKRGEKTLLFGPLRPVGLEDAKGNRPCAVVQLRQDNAEGTLYNMVGFQTNLKWGEQERVFRLIPALKDAEFVRKGVMHRNLFVCAPIVLDNLQAKSNKEIYFAGQITGVEGYVESTAMGLCAALFLYSRIKGLKTAEFPHETATGALLNYLKTALPESFQPMNANLGIMPKLPGKKIHKRAERCAAYAARSEAALKKFMEENIELFEI